MDEYLDVLDKNGNKTGEKKLRKLVHKDGNWHKGIDVAIVNSKKQLLIQKRSANKATNPNKWDISCAGHVAAGDTSLETVIRELKEELGLNVDPKEPQLLYHYIQQLQFSTNYFNNEFVDVYLLQKDIDITTCKLQKEEVSEIKWIDFAEYETKINNEDEQFSPHKEEYQQLFRKLHALFD